MGTIAYMAPELLKEGTYEGPPVDMFAIGVVLFMLVTGQFPFFKAGDYYFELWHNQNKDYMASRNF